MNIFMKYILLMILALLISAQTLFAADYVTFYHTDHVGTTLAISDSTGAVVWQADYKPFGEEHTVTGTAENKKRFVGKEKDTESGLSYFDARYEDAKTGRFISVDPVGAVNPQNSKTNEELLGNPQRLNSYAYGLNNPYRFVDIDGLWSVTAEAYPGAGGGLTVGKNPGGGAFLTIRYGVGYGGGLSFDPDGTSPGYITGGEKPNGATAGVFAEFGAGVGPFSIKPVALQGGGNLKEEGNKKVVELYHTRSPDHQKIEYERAIWSLRFGGSAGFERSFYNDGKPPSANQVDKYSFGYSD